jgi:glycogen debranching enzyme
VSLRFGREVVGDLGVAEQREWLVTNGTGGYGSGTIAGTCCSPQGCIAQAWSVGEVLRAVAKLDRLPASSPTQASTKEGV